MKEITCDNARREHALMTILGITVLAILMLLSIARAAPYAYVTNSGSNTVSVIDTATNKVTATVPVGEHPTAFGQFISSVPAQTVLPVANFSSNVMRVMLPFLFSLQTSVKTQPNGTGTLETKRIQPIRVQCIIIPQQETLPLT